MAKCFDLVGYVEPCNEVRKKYTGRAMLITGISEGESILGSVGLSKNGLEVERLFGKEEFVEFVSSWKGGGGQVVQVSIDIENPFGVTVQGNTDSGRAMYTKTIPISIPATRDGKAEEFIMGLQKGLYTSTVIVLESFGLDPSLGQQNDIFGIYSSVHIDPTSVTRSEYENGGAWNLNIVCDEPVPNVICTMNNLNSALDSLNA